MTRLTFPLPAELRHSILTDLLVSDPYAPLSFNPIRGAYRRDRECIAQLFALIQVSSAIRDEALEIFFSRNHFQFSTLHPSSYRVPISSSLIPDVIEPWVRDAVSRMQFVRLRVFGKPPHLPAQVRESVVYTTEILKKCRLKSLHVNFANRMMVCYADELRGREPGRHWFSVIAASGRCEHRPRKLAIKPSWAGVEAEVLEPLKRLRGVEYVSVLGSVTNRWALYLEKCILTPPGVELEDYEPGEEVPDPRWPNQDDGAQSTLFGGFGST